MCRQVTCRTCGRPSWAGCGNHVEQVLGHIPAADRCQGHAAEAARKPAREPARAVSGRSFLGRLLGR